MSAESEHKMMKSKKASIPLVCILLPLLLFVVSAAIVNDGSTTSDHHDKMQASLRRSSKALSTPAEARSANMIVGASALMQESKPSSTLGENVVDALSQNMDKITLSTPSQKMLVHSGQLSITAEKEKGQETSARIEDMVSSEGGYVEDKSSRRDKYYIKQNHHVERLIVDMTVRIPSAKFHAVLKDLQQMVGLTRINNLSVKSEDVTDSYVDATSRAETLKASQKAMQVLLSKANTVKDVLEVQRELNRITQEYESQKSRADNLQKQGSMSTLHVHLEEETGLTDSGETSDGHNDVFSARTKIFYKALSDVVIWFGLLVDIIIYAAVIAVSLAIPCFLLYGISLLCNLKQKHTALT